MIAHIRGAGGSQRVLMENKTVPSAIESHISQEPRTKKQESSRNKKHSIKALVCY